MLDNLKVLDRFRGFQNASFGAGQGLKWLCLTFLFVFMILR